MAMPTWEDFLKLQQQKKDSDNQEANIAAGNADGPVSPDYSDEPSEPSVAPSAPSSLFGDVSSKLQQKAASGDISTAPAPSSDDSEEDDTPQVKSLTPSTNVPIAKNTPVVPPVAPTSTSPYGAGLDDTALQGAQKQSNFMRLLGGLMNTGSTVSAALSRGNAKDLEVGKDVIANADMGEKNILQRREIADKDLARQKNLYDVATDKEKSDPSSSVSQMARDLMKIQSQKAGLNLPIGDNMSLNQLEKIFPRIESYFSHVDATEARKALASDKQDTKNKEQDSKRIQVAQTELNTKNKDYITAKAGSDAADEALKVLDTATTNPISANAVPIVMARLATHGQRINQTEINKLTGGQSLMDYGKRMAAKITSGTMTDTDYNNFKNLIGTYKQDSTDAMQKHEEAAAKRLSVLNNKSMEENYQNLTGNAYTKPQASTSKSDQVKVQLSDGRIVSGPKAKLDELKKRDPGLKVLE